MALRALIEGREACYAHPKIQGKPEIVGRHPLRRVNPELSGSSALSLDIALKAQESFPGFPYLDSHRIRG